MTMTQLIYASAPFGFDDAMLAGILLDARRCNIRDHVTGELIVRGDLFLQLLEGPKDKVEATYQRIRMDDRHVDVTRLMQRSITKRLFPGWAMRDDPAQSWIWSIEDVQNGAVEKASGDEVLSFFTRIAKKGVVPPRGPRPV